MSRPLTNRCPGISEISRIEFLSLFSGTTSLTNTGTNLTPNNNNLGTATLNVVPSVSSSSGQFGVDSGLTTANTNAALSLNPFLNQQSQAAQIKWRVQMNVAPKMIMSL